MAQTRAENLALCFQECLTVVVRLRSNRQTAPDAESFRRHMRETLKTAGTEAQHAGYTMEDVKKAAFAVVAFLDESVLNLNNPLFADWPRKPMQEELFGVHVAGETFFHNLQEILARNDSAETADLLEVYLLCLTLGYGGRYSLGGRGELQAMVEAAAAKIRRVRGAFSGFSPDWAPPEEAPRAAARDPWLKRLLWTAAGAWILGLLLFAIFKLSLASGLSELRSLAMQVRG